MGSTLLRAAVTLRFFSGCVDQSLVTADVVALASPRCLLIRRGEWLFLFSKQHLTPPRKKGQEDPITLAHPEGSYMQTFLREFTPRFSVWTESEKKTVLRIPDPDS